MKRNAVAWAALVVSAAALVSSRGLTRPLPAAPRSRPRARRRPRPSPRPSRPSPIRQAVGRADQRRAQGERRPARPRRPRARSRGPDGPHGNIDPKESRRCSRGSSAPTAAREAAVRPAEGTGSGFVYDDQGHILTNNHVVEGAEKIIVTFHDGTRPPAKVVGTDPETDVAVIKVDNTSYRPLPSGAAASCGSASGSWPSARRSA